MRQVVGWRPGGQRARVWVAALVVLMGVGWGMRPAAAGYAGQLADARWTLFTSDLDGLVSNSAFAIWVDDAALWFGGDHGVSRFDGTWTPYRLPLGDGNEVHAGKVRALARDPDTNLLWAGTDTGHVYSWNGSTWTLAFDLPGEVYHLAVYVGELWVGTSAGLYRFNGVERVWVDALGRDAIAALLVQGDSLWVGTLSGLWQQRAARWQQVAADEAQLQTGVFALADDGQGGLLAGTAQGIGWLPRAEGLWTWYAMADYDGAPATAQGLAVDHSGHVWVATDGAGLFVVSLGHGIVATYGYLGDPNLVTPLVRGVAVDQDNAVWVTTSAGVYRFQPYLWQTVEHAVGAAADDYVTDLLSARDGSLWVATLEGGVVRLVGDQRERRYTAAELGLEVVLALAQDAGGAIWVGGTQGLRRYVDGAWDTPFAPELLSGASVTSFLVDHMDVWIGVTGGLQRYEVTTGKLVDVTALAGKSVEALAQDNLGRVWAATLTHGIWVQEAAGTWRQFVHDPADPTSLPPGDIYRLALAGDSSVLGGMWAIVDARALVRWDGVGWRPDPNLSPLPSGRLHSLFADPEDGTLWIGSDAGATHYDGKTWYTFGQSDGLRSAVILAVARTRNGGYWFGGPTGLTFFQPERTPPWVKFGRLGGIIRTDDSGAVMVEVGQEQPVPFVAGDLQTLGDKLHVMYRVNGPDGVGPWMAPENGYLALRFDQPGEYTLELQARDQSFNYSASAMMDFVAYLPPVTIPVPGLGSVTVTVFGALAGLGSLLVVGSGYLTLVILSNRRRSLEALSREYNPYVSGEPVRQDDMFFGRGQLLQRIIDSLHNNSLMIHGERRIGKTSLLLQLISTLQKVDDPDYWFVPVYVDLEGTPQEGFFRLLIEEILLNVDALPHASAAIAPHLQGLRYRTGNGDLYSDRDFGRDLGRVIAALVAYGETYHGHKRLRLILLMDEMDVFNSYDRLTQQQLRRIFMREFALYLGAVVAGIHINKEWDRVESPWYNLFNEVELLPFTREQAVELLVEPVRGFYTYDSAALDFILQQADGRPYKLQQYGLESVAHMLMHRRRRITLADVYAAHRLIQAASLEPAMRQAYLRRAWLPVWMRGWLGSKVVAPPPAVASELEKDRTA